LAGCNAPGTELQGGWVGATSERGHRLRDLATAPRWDEGPLRRAQVLVVGGGVSGLACARQLAQAGVDVALLELEDEAGGNARGHSVDGLPCPLGAHYLPLPGAEAREVQQLLHELGLARPQFGRTVYDERHLCHAPQERLFFEGSWHEGLLPPLDTATPRRLTQYRRFAGAVSHAQEELGFAMPSRRARWGSGHAALDAQTFAQWLDRQGLDDAALRWYLDYCCRDDYGAGAAEVSAWAGLHYFASRHGFHAPGDAEGEREAVLTWPEGNAWLTRRMAQPLEGRIHSARTVLRVREQRAGVELLAWNEAAQTPERWQAAQLVLATPLFVARRLLEQQPAALRQLQLPYSPWLVSNLRLNTPELIARPGVGPAWDSVIYGSPALGYVDARHQSLDPTPRAGLITHYWALARSERGALLQGSWKHWAQRVVTELSATHADLAQRLQRIELTRWGHAMAIPAPGVRSSAALAALREQAHGRLHFAHSDLAGYSVFEEAYTQGTVVAERLLRRARQATRR
jgi:protoporphyrinogen oxidase